MPADDLGTVGLLDETSVVKKGKKTPGVQRQYCGAVGKQENCTVSVHLGVARGGYKALLDADLFLPQSWSKDRPRCQEAGIPDDVVYQPKWRLGLEQIYRAMGNGIVLDWLTFDEGYGCRPAFLAELDVLAELRWLGEVPKSFRCLTARPRGKKPRKGWTGKRADRLARYSPAFWDQAWRRVTLKRQTLSEQVWEAKAAQVHLIRNGQATGRTYWLIVARNPGTGRSSTSSPTRRPTRRRNACFGSPSRVGTWNTASGWPKARSVLAIMRGATTRG